MKYQYGHMEELEGIQFPDFKQHDGNLILFGAGINGALCAFALEQLGVEFLCFCDNDPSKQNQIHLDHPVYSLAECHEKYPNAVILFDVYCSAQDLDKLKTLGYSKVLFPAGLFLGLDCTAAAQYISQKLGTGDEGYSFREQVDEMQVFEWIDEYMIRGIDYVREEKHMSRAINLDLTDRCTLRCKNCLAMKPYFKNCVDMSWEDMKQVLDNLINMKWFRRFHLLGGEPFLYPHLDKVLNLLASVPEIEHVSIITNGTIVPNENVLKALQNPKLLVRISYYGDLSKNYKKLEDACIKNNINVRVHAQRWQDIGRIQEHVSSTEETQKKFLECSQRMGSFFYVLHGKATLCPFAANTHALDLYPNGESDVVDILHATSTEALFKELNTLYYSEKPLGACYICNGWSPYNAAPVPVAVQYQAGEIPVAPSFKK